MSTTLPAATYKSSTTTDDTNGPSRKDKRPVKDIVKEGKESLASRWWKRVANTTFGYVVQYQALLACSAGLALACICTALSFVIFLDGKSYSTHPYGPSVLSAIYSLFNTVLGIVLTQVIIISWWRSILRGTTVENLKLIWNRATVSGLLEMIFGRTSTAGGTPIEANLLAVTVFFALVSKLSIGPLLQHAVNVVNREATINVTMYMNIPQVIPDGWVGNVDITKLANVSLNYNFNMVIQQWFQNAPILTQARKDNYTCDGTCKGNVTGAGIEVNCSKTAGHVELQNDFRNGSNVFLIDFQRFNDPAGTPTLKLEAKYVTAVNDSCSAYVTVDTCYVQTAIVEYSVIINNETITLNSSQPATQPLKMVAPIKSSGDSLGAKDRWPAGPLAALEGLGIDFFQSNASVSYDDITKLYNIDYRGFLARQYLDTNSTHYNPYLACDYQFNSPTDDILRAFHEVLFRMALSADNGTAPMNFTALKTYLTPIYQRQNGMLAAAIVIMSLSLGIVLLPSFGCKLFSSKRPKEFIDDIPEGKLTDFKKDIHMSPVEIAQLFETRHPDYKLMGKDFRSIGVQWVQSSPRDSDWKMKLVGIPPDVIPDMTEGWKLCETGSPRPHSIVFTHKTRSERSLV